MIQMTHAGRLTPIWSFLDDPVAETFFLLNIEEFIEKMNGCAPDVIVRHSFAILRTLVMARYIHAKIDGAPRSTQSYPM